MNGNRVGLGSGWSGDRFRDQQSEPGSGVGQVSSIRCGSGSHFTVSMPCRNISARACRGSPAGWPLMPPRARCVASLWIISCAPRARPRQPRSRRGCSSGACWCRCCSVPGQSSCLPLGACRDRPAMPGRTGQERVGQKGRGCVLRIRAEVWYEVCVVHGLVLRALFLISFLHGNALSQELLITDMHFSRGRATPRV